MRIREEVGKYIQRLQQLAQAIATVDVLQSLASVAESQQLNRPLFHEERRIAIDKGRHPVVEKVMGAQSYIPNSIFMDEERDIQLITGPNMSGKSTYMRQLAIIVILAQIWLLCTRAKRPSCQSLMRFIPESELLMTWYRGSLPSWWK